MADHAPAVDCAGRHRVERGFVAVVDRHRSDDVDFVAVDAVRLERRPNAGRADAEQQQPTTRRDRLGCVFHDGRDAGRLDDVVEAERPAIPDLLVRHAEGLETERAGTVELGSVDVDERNGPRSGKPGVLGEHQTHRARAPDEIPLAGSGVQAVEGVDNAGERLDKRRLRERESIGQAIGMRRQNRDALGEPAGQRCAEAPGIGAQIAATVAAPVASSAEDRGHHSDPIAELETRHLGADTDHRAGELVARDARELRHRKLAVKDMEIRSADARRPNLNGQPAGPNLRFGDIGDLEAMDVREHDCAHGLPFRRRSGPGWRPASHVRRPAASPPRARRQRPTAMPAWGGPSIDTSIGGPIVHRACSGRA